MASSEIEIALVVQGSSWIALGWKPMGLTPECMNFPMDYDGYEDRDAGMSSRRKRAEEAPPMMSMECADMMIGMVVQGRYHRIGDYYSRDLATPNMDQWFGDGTYGLTAAVAKEVNGITTIKFRKLLLAIEQEDHSIVNGDMTVMWSRGQEVGSYHPKPAEHETNLEFYQLDELRWHGKDPAQRGAIVMNFYVDPDETMTGNCRGEWKTPQGCTAMTCDYRVWWSYDDVTDDIEFEITTRNGDKWTGIGFSLDTLMPISDAVIGWVDDGGNGAMTVVNDRWIESYQYGAAVDNNEDITSITGRVVDSMTTIGFKRKRNTGDQQDVALDGKGDMCAYFFYIVNGGSYNSQSNAITKHTWTPTISSQRVCVGKCEIETSSGTRILLHVQSLFIVLVVCVTNIVCF